MLNRLSHANVTELGMLRIHAKPLVFRIARDSDLAVGRRGAFVTEGGWRGDPGDVHFAGFVGELGRLVVLYVDVVDLIKVGRRTFPIGIACEYYLRLWRPLVD